MPLILTVAEQTGQPCQPSPEDQTLAQRYQQADLHDRLCLWLQFREARPALDLLEAAVPAPPPRRKGWLELILGLPVL